MPLVNRAPIDATGKLLVTTTAPTAAWPSLGGMTYDPTTGALAVIDAVPAANDPWVGAVRFTNIGQMYVWSAALPAGVEYVGGIPVTDDGRVVVDGSGAAGGIVVGGWPIGSGGGVPVNGLAAQPIFFAPLMTTLVPGTAGNPTFTFTRATTAYVADQDGILRQAQSSEARFQGARRVWNRVIGSSGDNTNNIGGLTSGVAVTPTTIDFLNAVAYLYKGATGTGIGNRYTFSVTLSSANKSAIGIRLVDNGTATANFVCPLTTTPTRFSVSIVYSSTGGQVQFGLDNRVGIGGDGTLGLVTATNWQLEDVSGQSNQAPGDYVSVGVLAAPYHGNAIDGVKYFPTTNGNSVAGNVVTEAAGTAIPTSLATNLALQSQTFDNAIWTRQGSTVVADSTTAPDGTVTADTLKDDNQNLPHRLYQTPITMVNGQVYTASMYAKAGTLNWFMLFSSAGGQTHWAYFNLATGALGSKEAGVTSTITALPNGWYRCTVTYTADNTGGSIQPMLSDSDQGVVLPAYQGTGNGTIFIWGAQLERGSVATTYLPTVASQVTSVPMLGYVAENAATNLCLQSQTFDNATSWTPDNAVIAADQIAAPDGTLTADRFTDNAVSSQHRVYQALGTTLTATPYTFSCYVKQGTLPWIQLLCNNAGAKWANFNLATGAVGNKSAGVTAAVQTLPNGWYRCAITFTGVVGGSDAQICSSTTDQNVAFPQYVGTGQTMYLWGAQVEQSSDPTSYIPTTTVAVVRATDALTYPMVSNLDGALATTYTEVFSRINDTTKQQEILKLSASGNQLQYYNQLSFNIWSGTGVTAPGSRSLSAVNKNADAWSGVTASICLNGGAVGTGAFIAQANSGNVAISASGVGIQGSIRNLKFYATRLTDAEIVLLTA